MYHAQWMYHETLAPKGRLIRNEAEEALLVEDGWFDTPAKFGTVTTETAPDEEHQSMALTTEADYPLPVGTVIPTLPGRRRRT